MLYDGASIYAQYEKTEADSRAESRRERLIRLAYSHASANSIPMPEKLIIYLKNNLTDFVRKASLCAVSFFYFRIWHYPYS